MKVHANRESSPARATFIPIADAEAFTAFVHRLEATIASALPERDRQGRAAED